MLIISDTESEYGIESVSDVVDFDALKELRIARILACCRVSCNSMSSRPGIN